MSALENDLIASNLQLRHFPIKSLHTALTPTRKSYRDSCWQFGYQALTGLGWLKNHVKVMGEREILNKSYKFSYGDIDFKAYSIILGGFRGNPLKTRVFRSCSENLVQLR